MNTKEERLFAYMENKIVKYEQRKVISPKNNSSILKDELNSIYNKCLEEMMQYDSLSGVKKNCELQDTSTLVDVITFDFSNISSSEIKRNRLYLF
jgi:hypothetical protein